MTMVNTKNILFICGGAFPELEGDHQGATESGGFDRIPREVKG